MVVVGTDLGFDLVAATRQHRAALFRRVPLKQVLFHRPLARVPEDLLPGGAVFCGGRRCRCGLRGGHRGGETTADDEADDDDDDDDDDDEEEEEAQRRTERCPLETPPVPPPVQVAWYAALPARMARTSRNAA